MPLASGKASLAICDRCNFKYHYQSLMEDGNIKGMRVCEDCRDEKDPWRLPPIRPDAITLAKPRPDTPLGLQDTHILQWDTPGITWDQPGITWDQQIADTGENI